MSAFTLSVRGDVKAVTRDLRRVSRVIVPRITSMALNRAIAKVRTKSIRDVAGAKAIPQSALRGKKAGVPGARRKQSPRMIIRGKATPNRLSVRILALVLPVLSSAIGKPRQRGTGASSGQHSFEGAFVARMRSGHVGVFRRQRPGKKVGAGARGKPEARGALPIMEQSVSLEPDASRIVSRHVETTGRIAFNREFERLLAVRLRTL